MKQNINFFQFEQHKTIQLLNASVLLQMIALFIVGLLSIYGYIFWQTTPVHQELSYLNNYKQQLSGEWENVYQDLSQLKINAELEIEIAQLQAQLNKQIQLINVLESQEKTNTIGFSTYLTTLAKTHLSGLWLTEINLSAGGNRISLTGQAISPELVPNFSANLETTAAFHCHPFQKIYVNRDKEKDIFSFELSTDMSALQLAVHSE